MKKPNVMLELLKFLGVLCLGVFIWLLIFSFGGWGTTDDPEPFTGAIVIFGILTGFITFNGMKYNSIHGAKQSVSSTYSNIKIFRERADIMLDKANRVVQKFMNFEKDMYMPRYEYGKGSFINKITNSRDFAQVTEAYPELKANAHVMTLLSQIEETENEFANAKLRYNYAAEYYNTLISSFPGNIMRWMFRMQYAQFYTGTDDIVSDESLGI